MKARQLAPILIAEDDPDDRLLVQEALHESNFENPIFFVQDGEELLDYLYRRGKFSPPAAPKSPGLILLDLNMPRKDGREALAEIKTNAKLRAIPIVVLSTTNASADIQQSYQLGANSFITKPNSFKGLVSAMRTIRRYWFKIVQLPTV